MNMRGMGDASRCFSHYRMHQMTNLSEIFKAGRVRRWHQNPDLSDTHDYNDGHAGRVARIILALHENPSKRLIIAALQHDDGEFVAGDISGPVKRENQVFVGVLNTIEAKFRADLWGYDALSFLSDDEEAWPPRS